MILDKIAQHKYSEVAAQKAALSEADLKSRIRDAAPPRDFCSAVRRTEGAPVRVIAEVKKASPSKGIIREDFEPVGIAQVYEANGASAVSVLTDEKFFQGSMEYLSAVKSTISLPVLRKDFIVDDYQIFQSRLIGADAILLIAALLDGDRLRCYQEVAEEVGLQCLVEVHDEQELDTALAAKASMIGVNNRDLRTFNVDISISMRLARRVPAGTVLVSESGISSQQDVRDLATEGIHAVLVGEALMREQDIGTKLRELASV